MSEFLDLLRTITHRRKIKIGQTWVFSSKNKNPFKEKENWKVIVKDIKNGYVLYDWIDNI